MEFCFIFIFVSCIFLQFEFNFQRYISWLPNFSVEVSNISSVLRNGHLTATIMQPQQQTSQLRSMARHVQEMFPRYPLNSLIADLQITHSIEHTIDNILEGRLPVPRNVSDDDSPSTSSGSPAYPTASDYYIAADEITASSSSSSSSSSSTDQYEIEQHGSAVFGNRADLLRDDSPESQVDPWGVSCSESIEDKFSKSSHEREKLLQRRKEQMLITARKR